MSSTTFAHARFEVVGAEAASEPEPGSLRLSLLGGFQATCAGVVAAVPPAAQRVVAFVALQERPVGRAYVAGRLWLDSSEQRANASLRTALWRAHVPDGELLASTATHLRLGPWVVVDVHEVLRAADDVLHGAGDPTGDALALLVGCGELLPEWYDDWLVLDRERVRQLRRVALEALCHRFSESGRHAEATEAGLAAVASEPLRESAHRALIQAYLAEGNSIDAIRQYRILAMLLQRDLGLAPSPATRALVTRARPDVMGV